MAAHNGQGAAIDVALCSSGLLWAWGYLIHFAGPEGFAEATHPLLTNYSGSAFLAASIVAYLVVIALFERHGEKAALSVSRVGCIAMTAGALVLVLSSLFNLDSAWFVLLGSALAGAGIPFCQVAWGVPLSKVDMDTLEKTVISWFPASGLVFLAIAASELGLEASGGIVLVMLVILPACAHVGFARSLERWGTAAAEFSSAGGAPVDEKTTRRQLVPLFASMLCSFMFLSFVWCAFTSRENLGLGLSMLAFFVGTLLLIVLTYVSLRQTRRFSLTTFYRWALPLAVLAIALASLGGPSRLFVSYVLLVAVYIGFDAIAKLVFIYGAQRYSDHAALVFGLGSLVICCGGVGGTFLWSLIERHLAGFNFATTMLVTLVPFVCAITFTMGREPIHAHQRMGAVVAGPKGEPAPTSDSAEQSALDQFDTLAAQYGLTPREKEVVELLAQGRSRSYIREMLYISKGTVDTHAYHAYAKLGIKTRDELMQLIDELRV